MKVPVLLAVLLHAGVAVAFPVASALAQEGCPNNCPEGMVWSYETGKCEPYKPLMV